jgi:hypothetical protein
MLVESISKPCISGFENEACSSFKAFAKKTSLRASANQEPYKRLIENTHSYLTDICLPEALIKGNRKSYR